MEYRWERLEIACRRLTGTQYQAAPYISQVAKKASEKARLST
jgi:hypothetical protein